MTLTEFLNMPNGMTIDEYEFLINKKYKLEKRIMKLANEIFDAEDSMEILSDEVGSDRYNKYLLKKQKAETKMEVTKGELRQLGI